LTNQSEIDYSIIIPVYCNQGTLKEIYHKILSDVTLHHKSKEYEIIFIDDGSYDSSFDEMVEVKNEDPERIKLIKFTRNFGQVPAIMAGYEYAKGNCIINISADLQDPPRLISDMLNSYYNENYEIVICYRTSREEPFLRRVTSKIFYKIINKLSFSNMPVGGFDFALISSRVKKSILNNIEANSFFQGQILWGGYNTKFIPYEREARKIGESKWGFGKKIKYLIDGVMGYSYFPLRAMSVTGIIISLLGFLYAIIIILFKMLGKVPIEGWAPIMVIVLMLSGIQMLMIGVVGEYLWRALDQIRNRSLYIIDKIYDDKEYNFLK
jgi:glycosyltransferase involved in cell wall biosynthesis